MTLEDFFTLTEMKNGLVTLERVEELLSVIQKQKDCAINNVADAIRQWSTVASTLAATENKDCLNHFVELHGLCFLNQWLQEALKYDDDANSSTVEELIDTILGSLGRLPVDREKSNADGIWATTERLLSHKSLKINVRAKSLFEKWNSARVDIVNCEFLENAGACQGDQCKPLADANITLGVHSSSPVDNSQCNAGAKEGSHRVESAGAKSHHSNVTRCADSSQSDTINDVKVSTPTQALPSTSLSSPQGNVSCGELNSLSSCRVSNSRQDNFSTAEECSVPAVEIASTGACNSPVGLVRDVDDRCTDSLSQDVDSDKKMEVDTTAGVLCKSSQKESCYVSSSSGLSASLSAQKVELPASCDSDSRDGKSCIAENAKPQTRSEGVDCELPKYLRTTKELTYIAHVAKGSQSNVCEIRKIVGNETSFQRHESIGSDNGIKELCSETNLNMSKGLDIMIPTDSSKKVEVKVRGEMDRSSEMELECGEIDALEVARQVAIEVEREVVDYREPFCSSSPEVNSGERLGRLSPNMVEDNQDQMTAEELNGKESPTGKDLSGSTSSAKRHSSKMSPKIYKDAEKLEDLVSPRPTTIAKESDCKVDSNRCHFDLNEDVSAVEFEGSMNPFPDNSVNLSAPIAIVAASKGAPDLPVSSLRFDGELGWRGSAATSAFRPASPRRTPDGEKMVSGQTQKTNFRGIDLNVAESEDSMALDTSSIKLVPPDFCSVDLSTEVSYSKAERFKLDLNCIGEEDASLQQSSCLKLHHQSGEPSLSSASSSSLRHPSMRDFDLNDSPSSDSHNLSISYSKATGLYGNYKLDDPVIMIMGSRMALDRKDSAQQVRQSYLQNGPIIEPVMSTTQVVMPYAHMPPPPYGYSGLATGPAIPYPPALYGHGSIPYMVDSRGATVMPQILGAAGLSGAPSATPPFVMSMASAPSDSDVAGASESGFDLNSGRTLMESRNRDISGLRQFFIQGHNGLMEEQTKSASQPATSGMPMKRKEPDYGWEPCALSYKQTASWQ